MRFWFVPFLLVVAIGSLLGHGNVAAQPAQSSPESQPSVGIGGGQERPQPKDPKTITRSALGEHLQISEREVVMSILVMLLGIIVLVIEYLLLRKSRTPPSDILRVFAVTLIIISALFIVAGAFDVNQITPVIGLLGTVAGYLMGKDGARTSQDGES